MSVPTQLQSNTIPMAISFDGGTTYKNVVCKRAWNFAGTTAVNSEETDCGISKGLGAPDWSMDFEGVVNTTPNSPTEVSAVELAGAWVNQTLVKVKVIPGVPIKGDMYITDYGVQNAVGSLLAFSFTGAGVGVPIFTV